jgi:hypothetical protein
MKRIVDSPVELLGRLQRRPKLGECNSRASASALHGGARGCRRVAKCGAGQKASALQAGRARTARGGRHAACKLSLAAGISRLEVLHERSLAL